MILFSHSAFTMEAIASSGDFKVISVGLFSTDVIKYSVYPDGGKEKDDEIISDVNNHALLTIDLNPKVDGYLRDGTIRAVDLEGNAKQKLKLQLMLQRQKRMLQELMLKRCLMFKKLLL